MLKTTPSHQSALSLIEILVAVTLISFVLIALASNIFYTQRVIIDARLRAKAVDQANSCLERWRTARDGMLWWQFYQRLKCHCAKDGDDIPRSGWIFFQNVKMHLDTLQTVCLAICMSFV